MWLNIEHKTMNISFAEKGKKLRKLNIQMGFPFGVGFWMEYGIFCYGFNSLKAFQGH